MAVEAEPTQLLQGSWKFLELSHKRLYHIPSFTYAESMMCRIYGMSMSVLLPGCSTSAPPPNATVPPRGHPMDLKADAQKDDQTEAGAAQVAEASQGLA